MVEVCALRAQSMTVPASGLLLLVNKRNVNVIVFRAAGRLLRVFVVQRRHDRLTPRPTTSDARYADINNCKRICINQVFRTYFVVYLLQFSVF